MSENQPEMKSIWYFVGLTLLVMGVLVVAAGISVLISPPARPTVLDRLHPNFWWGGVMIVAGICFWVFGGKKHPGGETDAHE